MKPKAKDKLVGALVKPVNVGVGPAKICMPAIVFFPTLILILAGGLVALYFWLQTPAPVRVQKAGQINRIIHR